MSKKYKALWVKEDLHSKIKELAQKNGRTISGQLRVDYLQDNK